MCTSVDAPLGRKHEGPDVCPKGLSLNRLELGCNPREVGEEELK